MLPNTVVGSSIDNLTAGQYMLEVTDASGCRSYVEFFINDPPAIDVTLYYINPSTDSTSDGDIISVVKGGEHPLTYNWQNSENRNYRLTDIDTGEYLLQVMDVNGCTGEGRVFVYGRPNDCINATPTGYCLPVTVAPCDPGVPCYKDIVTDFGADPSGLTNSQCAFEAASEFFNARRGYGTLNIPPGTYKVGVQFDKSQYPHLTFGKTGSDVLCFKDCHNLTIQGKIVGGLASKIIFDDCLQYGVFDPATGQRLILGNTEGLPYRYLTAPGNFLVALECSNLSIRNLDIDGNTDNMSYGGHYNDGIQIPADGIVLNSVRTARLENVNVHHFGRDGLALYDNLVNPAGLFNSHANLTIMNSRFNYNGRIGFYWGGGKSVNALNSEFNHNADARFGSKAADGIDYEYFGGIPMENGRFTDCEFMYNAAYGIEVYASNRNHAVSQEFIGCIFASGENTYCATPNGRKFEFRGCRFYGPLTHAFSDFICQACTSNDNTKFIQCEFYEELNGFSHNLELPTDPCPTWKAKSWLIDFSTGAARALFQGCVFKSNKDLKLINLTGGTGVNEIRMENCVLNNHLVSHNDLGRISNVYVQNSELHVVHPGHDIYENGLPTNRFIKFVDRQDHPCQLRYTSTYPNRVTDAFTCANCTIYAPPFCPASPGCSPCPRLHSAQSDGSEKDILAFPNPFYELVSVSGIHEGDNICIHDLYGKMVFSRAAASDVEKISLKDLSSGIYIMMIGQNEKVKLIKR